MHYKNGREAKNGDRVVLLSGYVMGHANFLVSGILYDAVDGKDLENGRLAMMSPRDPCPNLSECLHLDDVASVLLDEVAPDTSSDQQPAVDESQQEDPPADSTPVPVDPPVQDPAQS